MSVTITIKSFELDKPAPSFERNSTAYLLDATQVGANAPRYEYVRHPSPIWQDLFDTNKLDQYTSGGNVLATWTAITGPVKQIRMKGKSEKNHDYGYLYGWDGELWGLLAQRSSPDLFVEYDEWVPIDRYVFTQIKTRLTTDVTYLESPTYVDIPEAIVGDNNILVPTGGTLYLSTTSNSADLYSSSWAPPEVLEVTGGDQATLIKNDLSLQDCEAVINSDQAHDSGIIARYQDNNNYYMLVLRDDSGLNPPDNLLIYKRVGGVFMWLGGANVTWPRGTSKQIKFSCKGSCLEAYFGGVKVLSVVDTTFTSGSVGLRNNSPTAFRVLDFTVYYASTGVMMEEGTTNLVKTNAGATADFSYSTGWTLTNASVASGVLTLQSPDGVAVSLCQCTLSNLLQNSNHSYLIRARYKDSTGTAQNLTLDLQASGYDNAEQELTIASSQLTTTFQDFKKNGFDSQLAPATVSLRIFTFSTRPIEVDFIQLENKLYATTFHNSTRVSEVMTIPTTDVFIKGSWTVEMTISLTSNYGVPIPRYLWYICIDSNNYYNLMLDWSSAWWAEIRSGGTSRVISGGSTSVGGIYNVMLTGDGSIMRLFVNGAQIGSDLTYTEQVGTLPVNMYIGSKYNSSAQLNGIIDNLRISSRARTLAEHQAAYQSLYTADIDTTILLPFNGNLDAVFPSVENNRSGDVKIDGFGIEQVLGHEQDTCTFTLKSGDRAIEGQEVIVSNDGVKIFAGIITAPKDIALTTSITWYQVEAVDYSYMLNRRLVVETYENISASAIVIDIITNYCSGFTGTGIIPGSPLVEYIKFDYIRPTECFTQLAEYIGWQWYVDYDRDVKFFESYDALAPVEIIQTTAIRGYQHDVDIQGLRNKVYVLGGRFLSGFQTFEYVADGKQRVWVLAYEPHSPSVMVSEVPKTVGLENVDDEINYDYMYNQREKLIRCSAQTTTPISGSTMAFAFKYPMDVITLVEDLDSQQAVSAIQGGDGVYEHKIVDDSLVTIEAAEAAGLADLAEHANPKIRGSFETEIAGFSPGQLLTINMPDKGITGQFVIQRVNISELTSSKLIYKITYGGRLKGIPDLLKALVSGQQQKKIADVKYQTKFVAGDEYAGVLDTALIAFRTTPWYCGDVDAIIGDVVCL